MANKSANESTTEEDTSEAELIGETDSEYESIKESEVVIKKKLSKWFFNENLTICSEIEISQEDVSNSKYGFVSQKECESSCILTNIISKKIHSLFDQLIYSFNFFKFYFRI